MKDERGSAIVIILVAIILFAALSFAVGDMLRSESGEKISEQKAALMADEILDYGRQVKQAVQYIRVSNGCSDTDVSFENNLVSGYTNGTNTNCQVFHPDGGGINFMAAPDQWLDSSLSATPSYGFWRFTGRFCVPGLGTATGITCASNGDSSDDSLEIGVHFLNKQVCMTINDKLGIDNPSDDAPIDSGCGQSIATKFTGTYSDGGAVNPTALEGEPVACIKTLNSYCSGQPDHYMFYQILIPR